MVEKKKKRKGTISERNVATLLHRYSPSTIFSVLQEVAQVAEEKFDWDELVKNTSTGISNAREYQMLWRHLAYRDPIAEELEDGAKPMDDDSDLEYELEAHPPISGEASIEASAIVKVLIASGLQGASSLASGMSVEAPLIINVPTTVGLSEDLQQQGINITIPVCVPKQPLNMPTVPFVEINGPTSCNLPPRKKRKQWSEEEDRKLRAAVLRCGDGSWATILKEDFCGERTVSQLAQRWGAIKKKKQQGNVGGSSQISDIHIATRRAMNYALDMPIDNHKITTLLNSGGTTVQQDIGPSKKVQTITKGVVEDPVKAAAVAAGARIASASDAASLLLATRGKSAVHMTTSGSGLPPNVHFIRTGLVTTTTNNNNPSSSSSTHSLIHQRPQIVVVKSANPTTNAAAAAKAASQENKPAEVKTVEDVFSIHVKEENKEDEAVVNAAADIADSLMEIVQTTDADMSNEKVEAENVQLEDGNKNLEQNKKDEASSNANTNDDILSTKVEMMVLVVKEDGNKNLEQNKKDEASSNANDDILSIEVEMMDVVKEEGGGGGSM
ncbi:uncharacterized protein LOC124916720 [Impatiens glandulifera]|uniref:uncharacterized protein LOC124916720 n=1 Tax=Impatiens glandulifera TaxID=253017 RepID=UPI001FB0528B|nr:uncharacterized protein LOC124916720 [Impatiens glandulifera]